jgi:hypothetical protein
MIGTGLPGSLPPLDWPPVATPWYQRARIDIVLTLATSSIATISGPSGTGKTTTAVACVREDPIDLRYAALTHGAGVKDIVVGIHEALHGARRGSARDSRTLRGDIIETLANGGLGIIADEVHYSGVGGMLTLAQLWERVRQANGVGFPLFLIGATVQQAISRNEELLTRVEFPIRMDILSKDDVVTTVQAINPRCAATPEKRLLTLDDTLARGNLRRWSHFIRYVQRDPTQEGQPIAPDEFKTYVAKHRATSGIRTSQKK